MDQVRVTGIDDLNRLAAELDTAAGVAPEEARKVVAHGAFNIKKDWRQAWTGLAHAPALPYAISYDVRQVGGRVAAEIGPDKDKRQGALGNLIEYGSVNNAPRPGGLPALEREAPRFEKAMEDLAVRALEGR